MHARIWIIATALGIVLLVSGIIAALWIGIIHSKERAFLATLQGEIIFLRRDKDIQNLYRIPASGGTPMLLFRNEYPEVSNRNTLFPHWSDDGKKIRFIANDGNTGEKGFWKVMEMREDGSNVRIVGEASGDDLLSTLSRSSEIEVKEGSVFVVSGDSRNTIYSFGGYDSKLNRGASEASWSPDHHFIIFDSCSLLTGCGIYIADREGQNLVRLTDGIQPDWTL